MLLPEIFVVGAARRGRRVDRHRALRVKARNPAFKRAARPVDVAAHCLVAFDSLFMETGRQLDVECDLGEDRIQGVGKWVVRSLIVPVNR